MYTVTVNETAPPDHPRPQSGFLTLTCTPNSSYIIHYPTSDLPFEIDPDTGELNATADIDYDSMEEGFELFTFNVSCSDSFNNASALALVQVYVAPVNEFLPEIDHSLVLNITEATPSGSLLLSSLPGAQRRLLVHDRDRGPHGQLNFTLLTSLSDHFSFDPIHGNLTLVRAIDFESEQSMFTYIYLELPVKIRVCDRDIDIEACPIIHFPLFIIASDDNEPAFLNTSYSATVNESIAVGSSLLTLECFDADVYIGVVRRITFLDPPADVEQTFSLQRSGSPGSVEVVLANELDFDQRNQTYQFEVGCEDFLHTATATITIHILDVNDNAPKFSNPLHETVVVPDTITPGAVHSVRCTDQDSGENSDIVYEILPQHSLFAVDQTGRVLVNIPLLLPDFTLSQSHNISIECRDKGSPSLSSNKTLTLTISKTDSQPPHINISHTSVSVLENSSTGEPVLILSVYDVDSEAVIITIASQSLPGTFAVSPSAPYNHPNYPVLIVNGSLDREDGATHLIHLVAISVSTTAQQQNTSFSLNISVEDVNDNAPKFSNPLHETVVVPDTITPGAVHSVRCTDQDSGENSDIVYEILPQHSLFAVDQTGRVLVNIPLLLPDFTLSQSHNISIECRDKGSPSLSSNKTLTLTISKTDSQPPHINISHTSVSVLENSSTGEPVLILSVYDVDSEAVIITIASQSLPGTFAVSPSAPYNHPNYPVLIVNGSLDREDGATHLIHLVAISVSTTAQQQNTSFSLNISVEDVNDNAPKFSNPLHETVVVPDTITPGAVHSVRCTDQDSGENSEIVYEILPQHSLFAVDQTGRVLVNIPLLLPDFTLSQSHNISIECRDKGSPSLSSNKTLTLTISKTDSQPPHINISHTSVSVLENSSTGEPVLILSVYDVDSEAVIITIASQSLPGTFAVSPSAPYNHPNYPVLIVNGSLDREDGATHLIHLVAISVYTSAQQQNTSFSLNISVEDVNDNAPKFSNPLHETVVVADTITPGAVHSVRCTDQDSGENSDIVYEILPQHSLFAVDQTGRVLVNIPLLLPDFTLSQSHNISIECRDKGSPSLSSNKTLTLTISKTDSQRPHINISHTSVSVLENSSTGEPVLILSVYDVDSEAVIITIASQSLPGTFAVSPSAPYNHPNYPVLIVNGSLDREDGATHLIHLVAISVSTTAQQQNTSFSLNISVEDVNDNAPKCREESTVSLTGGEFRSTTIVSLSCSDADVGLNQRLTYSLTNTAPPLSNGQFTIDQISGELRLEGVVDKGEYRLTVRVSDMGTPPMATDVGIQVNVVEVEKGEVASNESGLPLMLIIIIVVLSVVVLVSMVGGCGLCCCCWYRSRKSKNKDYFVR